jgi:hypothetical protein
MFTGYFGRRRLKTLLISIILSLIILIFIHLGQNNFLFSQFLYQLNIRKQVSDQIRPSSNLIATSNIQTSLQKKSHSVLSAIEFFNSPYLDLESQSFNIIPIIVLSKVSNIDVRDAIRRTWAFNQLYRSNTIQVKVFFLVGTDDYTIKRIRAEQTIFSDVIQVSIPDIYSFIAYKELSAMMWIKSYLPNAPFYIKTEDDVIINMKAIIDKLLPIIESVINENLIIGWFGLEHSVQRGTYQKFIDAVLPPVYLDISYAMSLLYVVTSKASDRMLDTLSHVDSIEHSGDLFVTGFLRDAAQVQIKNLAASVGDYRYELSNGACTEEFQKNSKLLLCTSSLHIGSNHSVSEYFKAWNLLLSQN